MNGRTVGTFLSPRYSERLNKLPGIAVLVAAMPLLMTSSCQPQAAPANIHYEQIGACNGFSKPRALGGGSQTPAPGHAYIVFRIKTITNTEAGAIDFSFDPEKLYINEEPRPYGVGYFSLGWNHPRAVEKRVVKAGTTETFNGTVTVETSQGDAATAKDISFFLLFDTPAGAKGAVVTKDNSARTSWIYTSDCADIEKESPNP